MDPQHIEDLKKEYERLSADGFRVLAIATKDVEPRQSRRVTGTDTLYGKADECDLILERLHVRSSIRPRRPPPRPSRPCRVTASRSRF
jgi:magnesium-transporting ATPase (P-type)